jgi:hypothetical protein
VNGFAAHDVADILPDPAHLLDARDRVPPHRLVLHEVGQDQDLLQRVIV